MSKTTTKLAKLADAMGVKATDLQERLLVQGIARLEAEAEAKRKAREAAEAEARELRQDKVLAGLRRLAESPGSTWPACPPDALRGAADLDVSDFKLAVDELAQAGVLLTLEDGDTLVLSPRGVVLWTLQCNGGQMEIRDLIDAVPFTDRALAGVLEYLQHSGRAGLEMGSPGMKVGDLEIAHVTLPKDADAAKAGKAKAAAWSAYRKVRKKKGFTKVSEVYDACDLSTVASTQEALGYLHAEGRLRLVVRDASRKEVLAGVPIPGTRLRATHIADVPDGAPSRIESLAMLLRGGGTLAPAELDALLVEAVLPHGPRELPLVRATVEDIRRLRPELWNDLRRALEGKVAALQEA